MKPILIAVVLLVGSSILSAQPEVDWVSTYGGAGGQYGEGFVVTEDGGFALSGSNGGGNLQFWLTRINEGGEQLWDQTYDIEGQSNECYDLVQTEDGGFLLVGMMREGQALSWLAIRVDEEGEEVWRNVYIPDGGVMNWAEAVVAQKDDQFVIAGGQALNNQRPDGFVIKINGNGEIIWQQTYGDDQSQHFHDIVIAPGGYAMCGYSMTDESVDAWLVRIDDEEGEEIWQQAFGDEEVTERALGLVLTQDNGFALAGYSAVGENAFDYYLILTNGDGDLIWQNTYDVNRWDIAYAVVQEIDGGFTAAGQQNVDDRMYSGHAINTDAAGNLNWDFAEGEPFFWTEFTDAKIYPEDNSTIFCGTTYVENALTDAMLVKMTPVNHPPEIISRTPEDTIVFVLQGEDSAFNVEAIDIDGDELSYIWTLDEDTVGVEDLVIIQFDETGDFELTCGVSDWEFTVTTGWLVRVMTLIAGHTPEARELIVTQGDTVSFVINPGIDPDSLDFLWMMDNDNLGADTTIMVTFEELGHFTLIAWAMTEALRDSVVWSVNVIDPDGIDLDRFLLPHAVFVGTPYPNPFNDVLNVRFDLPQPTSVKISLVSTTGQVVSNLYDKGISDGNYSVGINSESLSAGVYFLNIKVGEFSSNHKVVYLP